ncbi:terminase large subunit [Cryobacterium sp. Y57]|uniref:terminase large subunit n=1 Tax=Cryobacterium sp. Y57 TaxID=2048287 RepID=UPI0013049A77|nr:terminase large subunit [Cryobacterium sp. Y57]
MTNSESAVRKGSQLPRIESFPFYATTAADDAIDLAAVAGLFLDPWQEYVLRGSLGEKRNGKWSAFRCGLVVPRQNGKNALLEARELAGLFLFGEKRIIHTAHETKTARESMQSLMNRMKQSPDLMEQVLGFEGDLDKEFSGMKVGNDPSITLKGGAKISYAARSKGSGRGFTGDLIVMDEAYALKTAEMAAMLPTMAAKSMEGNPQIWFTSSAGMPESDLLEAMRQEGIKKSSDRLAYFEWSADDDAPIDDVESWYQANPGLGIRISEQYVRDEYEVFIEADAIEEFKRERLGIWAKLGGESVFGAGVWAALMDPPDLDDSDDPIAGTGSQPGDQKVFAVEIAANRESASIALLSFRADELVHAEIIENRVGTSWIGTRLAELQKRWNPIATVAIAGGHVDSLVPSWKRDGARVKLIKFADYVKACGVIYDWITQGKLRHLDDPILNAAIEGVQQKFTRDNAAWYWSRVSSDVDITSLVALTVAVAGLEKKTGQSRPVGERRGRIL